MLFAKKKKDNLLYINKPVKGKVIRLEELKDLVFSEKMMGEGFAVIPKSNEIRSPISGKVIYIAETLHAICLKGNNGEEILIHIGIDTVRLKGKGFASKVNPNDNVKVGEPLLHFDREFCKQQGFDVPVIIIFLNYKDYDICLGLHKFIHIISYKKREKL